VSCELPVDAKPNVAPHVPVLLAPVISGLAPQPGGHAIDCTLGLGGYTERLLEATAPEGQVLGLDADPDALRVAAARLARFGDRVHLAHSNFRNVATVAAAHGFVRVDCAVLDLGLSSWQLAGPSRGFSFMQDDPLDMRFDRSQGETAADLVNELDEADLRQILWDYGEEDSGRRIARAIVEARPIRTTGQLAQIVERVVGHRGRIHPATKTFQALRIATNDELGALHEALPQIVGLLRPGGRLAVVSFHSLEDRIVKDFFRTESKDCICDPRAPACTCNHRATLRLVNRKPIVPDDAELSENRRARSAKLRIAETV
jgi:16S rRNA (cytosine1402-N4)-methyltransferase